MSHFARIYTPAVLAAAVVMAAALPVALQSTVREGIYRALVLLVIACPCAIVLSVPLAYYTGIGGAARGGILFTGSAAVENAASVSGAVFEKAGALEGEGLRVLAVKSERMDADTLLRIAAHACAYSDGRYAESIKAAYQDTIYIELIQSFQQDPGQGITVEVDGVSILLGLESFVRDHGIDPGEDVSDELCAYLAIDGQYAGRIMFGSAVKPGAAEAVRRLTWDADRPVVMLAEDPPAAAEKFARSAGIARSYGGADPAKRLELLRTIKEGLDKKGSLLFVGSAETDADCLREADLGLAMNGEGSDAALASADIVVMDDSLSGIAAAMAAARRVRAIQRQNLIAVLAFKLIILLLDILGVCPLWLAVLSDAGVALGAILNTLRALSLPEPRLP